METSRTDDAATRTTLSRRGVITVLGGAGAGAVYIASGGLGSLASPSRAAAATGMCVLTPEVTEGPYWISNSLWRRDITAGRPGVPLRLRLRVVDASTCAPISSANVEVWHADAGGDYSGYDGGSGGGGGGHQSPSTSTRYLRGHQRSGSDGWAVFDTIYPGWYPGRATHIHLKVHVGGSVVHTGQVFFPMRINRRVHANAPYTGTSGETTNASDSIYHQAGDASARLAMRRRNEGYRGSITLGVAT